MCIRDRDLRGRRGRGPVSLGRRPGPPPVLRPGLGGGRPVVHRRLPLDRRGGAERAVTVRVDDVPSLVRALVASDPGRPRVTWYGADGERVELSGHVLENWVAKTANLLVEECDAGPGTTVALDLPPHWRTVVWALAAWSVGATLAEEDADVVVTADPASAPDAGQVVAVTLAALARRFEGDGRFDVDDAAEVSLSLIHI